MKQFTFNDIETFQETEKVFKNDNQEIGNRFIVNDQDLPIGELVKIKNDFNNLITYEVIEKIDNEYLLKEI